MCVGGGPSTIFRKARILVGVRRDGGLRLTQHLPLKGEKWP